MSNLPLYHFYMKVAVGQAQDAFLAQVNNFTAEGSDEIVQDVLAASRSQYATRIEEIETAAPAAVPTALLPQTAAAETAVLNRLNTATFFPSNPTKRRSKVGVGTNTVPRPAAPLAPAPLTHRQIDIIHLLAQFRFLNRIQIQRLLNHQHHKTIIDWLNDLTDKEYLQSIEPKTFTDHSKPTVYYLATNAIPYIKRQTNQSAQSLRKLYREHKRSDAFIRRSLLLADIYLDLRDRTTEAVQYAMVVPGQHQATTLGAALTTLAPHGYVIRKTDDAVDQQFIELFDDVPLAAHRTQFKRYATFFASEPSTAATMLLICTTPKVVSTVKSLAKKLSRSLAGTSPIFLLTTADKIVDGNITADIWQKIA